MKAIRVHEAGAPEVMRLEELPTPEPAPGQALMRVEAAGVNFRDVYRRTGQYKGQMPFTPGMEGGGVVEAIGQGVAEIQPGDRVGWAAEEEGSYATHCLIRADQLVPLPAPVSTRDAATTLLQGLAAHVFSHRTYPIRPGDVALVHAGAGGVGRLLVQMLKLRGARVIATVSSKEKGEIARGAGADETILYTEQDFAAEARRLTEGHGVHVVYDSVGRDTFDGSLAALRPRGWLVCFGQSSGPVPPFEVRRLMDAGSVYLTRASMVHYMETRQELLHHANAVFDLLTSGKVQPRLERTYPLIEAGQAHHDLVSRRYAGKLLLLP